MEFVFFSILNCSTTRKDSRGSGGPTHKMANIISSKPNPNQFFTDVWLGTLDQESKGFMKSINTHFRKISHPTGGKPALNKVVIDYKYFEDISLPAPHSMIKNN